MANFSGSHCPGECYGEFWEQPIQKDPLTVEGVIRKYRENQAQRPYSYFLEAINTRAEGGTLKAKFDDFPTVLKIATLLHETGHWVVNSITRQQ